MTASLGVSIVTYEPHMPMLDETLRALSAALDRAANDGLLKRAQVTLVDNGPGDGYAASLVALLEERIGARAERALLSGHGNVGYGRAHNLALLASSAEYHVVVNPDVALAPDAIGVALEYLRAHPDTIIVAPGARDTEGEPLHLCKRYPSVLDLALRGFAPGWLRRAFDARLARYEMRDLSREAPARGIPIVSGSCMFLRRAPIAELGGFSDAFFLYFEDFDLSLRAAAKGSIDFVPSARIVHRGGYAARKGVRHVAMFARSAATFFGRHGWKWL